MRSGDAAIGDASPRQRRWWHAASRAHPRDGSTGELRSNDRRTVQRQYNLRRSSASFTVLEMVNPWSSLVQTKSGSSFPRTTRHGSRSSMFVNQETGQAMTSVWNAIIKTQDVRAEKPRHPERWR